MIPPSSNAFRILVQDATMVGANAHDWALLIYEESDWNPHIKNGSGAPYYGLNQMGVGEMRGVGFTGSVDQWLALTVEGQLPYATKFFTSKIRAVGPVVLASAAHMLAANFLPARVKGSADASDVDYALCLRGEGNNFYEANKAYDAAGKGTITIRDLGNFLRRKQTGNPRDTALLTSGVNAALASFGIRGRAPPRSPTRTRTPSRSARLRSPPARTIRSLQARRARAPSPWGSALSPPPSASCSSSVTTDTSPKGSTP